MEDQGVTKEMKIKNRLYHTIVLFLSLVGFCQGQEYLKGQIVTRAGDSIYGRIRVLDRFQSFRKLYYLTEEGTENKIPIEDIRMYKRGNEEYETLILAHGVYVLAKKLIHGPNIELYVVEYKEPLNQRLLNEALGKKMPTVRQHKYLKLSTGQVINATMSSRRKIKKFLHRFPLVVEKIENKVMDSMEEIVVECNSTKP
ncbi:hypothetical protein [Flagellimonas okinawensis]|uniref:DUF4369 domain-containing protein n=1 Tax=Flagellimonas okinawensis TaxID=3031324 RepID=A0ABT5XT33_9FLAO|nr:hypothetical protein [[Muricauda] okinawensis]MDF0709029.1 hypothetical protein [[Muricauda] okinawensis]